VYDDLVEHAGGLNAIVSRVASYPALSLEGLLRLDPDAIIELSETRQDVQGVRREWIALEGVRAARAGRVHVFTGDFLTVPGPRLVRFAETLARTLHGAGQ
jgi:iron complex transport system substrate-binding protein